jgi:SAM-dependent methyltransferase
MPEHTADGATLDWSEFNRQALTRPPRELLRRTLGCFDLEGRAPGIAVDLGCGSGPDTIELLRRGWYVHAVDENANGLAMLRGTLPPEAQSRLDTHETRFENFDFPSCDLVWSSWSLPFCPAERWPKLLQRIVTGLRPNGRFAGDLFGKKHAFASEPGVFTLTEAELRKQLANLTIEAFDIEDGVRPSGGAMTRWHAFGIAVRVPMR